MGLLVLIGSSLIFGLIFGFGAISDFESGQWGFGSFVFALLGLVFTSIGLWMAQDRIRNAEPGTLELAGTVTKGTWEEGDSSYIRISRTKFEVCGRFLAGEEVVVMVYKRAWQRYTSRSGSISQHDIVRIRRGTSSTAEQISFIERHDTLNCSICEKELDARSIKSWDGCRSCFRIYCRECINSLPKTTRLLILRISTCPSCGGFIGFSVRAAGGGPYPQ